MQVKPVIGINSDFRSAAGGRPAYSVVTAGYFECVAAAGGVPVILPPIDNDDDLVAVLDRLDGVVLIGGADLDPQRDGYMRHSSMRILDERREDFDRRLMRQIGDRRLPVFGIGAGMQLLNLSQGGNHYFHLPEDLPETLPHRDIQDKAHNRHGLVVTPGTIMERVFGDGEIRVNSMHHMAIDQLAPGFIVSARAPDGVIEAIESEMPDWLAMGTQFHPEATTASALDKRIFEEFLLGIRGEVPQMRMVA